jgi:hypothetical protein
VCVCVCVSRCKRRRSSHPVVTDFGETTNDGGRQDADHTQLVPGVLQESEEFRAMALVYKLNDSRMMDCLSSVSHQLHALSEQVKNVQHSHHFDAHHGPDTDSPSYGFRDTHAAALDTAINLKTHSVSKGPQLERLEEVVKRLEEVVKRGEGEGDVKKVDVKEQACGSDSNGLSFSGESSCEVATRARAVTSEADTKRTHAMPDNVVDSLSASKPPKAQSDMPKARQQDQAAQDQQAPSRLRLGTAQEPRGDEGFDKGQRASTKQEVDKGQHRRSKRPLASTKQEVWDAHCTPPLPRPRRAQVGPDLHDTESLTETDNLSSLLGFSMPTCSGATPEASTRRAALNHAHATPSSAFGGTSKEPDFKKKQAGRGVALAPRGKSDLHLSRHPAVVLVPRSAEGHPKLALKGVPSPVPQVTS